MMSRFAARGMVPEHQSLNLRGKWKPNSFFQAWKRDALVIHSDDFYFFDPIDQHRLLFFNGDLPAPRSVSAYNDLASAFVCCVSPRFLSCLSADPQGN